MFQGVLEQLEYILNKFGLFAFPNKETLNVVFMLKFKQFKLSSWVIPVKPTNHIISVLPETQPAPEIAKRQQKFQKTNGQLQ